MCSIYHDDDDGDDDDDDDDDELGCPCLSGTTNNFFDLNEESVIN